MPLIQVLVVLIVVGVLLWLANRFMPMAGSIKRIAYDWQDKSRLLVDNNGKGADTVVADIRVRLDTAAEAFSRDGASRNDAETIADFDNAIRKRSRQIIEQGRSDLHTSHHPSLRGQNAYPKGDWI